MTIGWKQTIDDHNEKVEALPLDELLNCEHVGNFACDSSLIKRLDQIMRDESLPWPTRIKAFRQLDITMGCEQADEDYTPQTVETEIYFQKIMNEEIPHPPAIVCGWHWEKDEDQEGGWICYRDVAFFDPTYGWRIH